MDSAPQKEGDNHLREACSAIGKGAAGLQTTLWLEPEVKPAAGWCGRYRPAGNVGLEMFWFVLHQLSAPNTSLIPSPLPVAFSNSSLFDLPQKLTQCWYRMAQDNTKAGSLRRAFSTEANCRCRLWGRQLPPQSLPGQIWVALHSQTHVPVLHRLCTRLWVPLLKHGGAKISQQKNPTSALIIGEAMLMS